jgi:RNA polymerase sigma-70 factor (ECF subfamily)
MVLSAAGADSSNAPRALEELCQAYWFPLYAFVRRHGWSPQDAEDLTQDFFARILDREMLAGVGPEKGRFRTFLLVCLKRFLVNERERRGAAKRGGGRQPLSLNHDETERQYALVPSTFATPEQAFQRRWVMTLLEHALQKLASEFATRGKEKLFNYLKVYLAADQAAPPYAEMADRMGITEAAVKVAVHRLRGRFRVLLEEEIVSTLEDPNELGSEIDFLMDVLSR